MIESLIGIMKVHSIRSWSETLLIQIKAYRLEADEVGKLPYV